MAGYVDPRLVASTPREHLLLAEVLRRGLCLHKLHASGEAVRLTGPGGLHVTVESLRGLFADDLDDDTALRRRAAPQRR